ncbi:MAG: TIGR03943 family putative permease subunit [Actinomycetota bacterium]
MSRRWSPVRLLTTVVLVAWATLFWFVLLADRTSLYLSTRTDWIVPLGAIALTIAALGRLASIRTSNPEPIRAKDAGAFALLVIPVVIVLALPPAALGSFAASRRSTLAAGGFGSTAEQIASGEVTLIDVAGALRSREGMRALVARAGEQVSFVGFVSKKRGLPADEFILTRFLVSCCVADALSVQVRVVDAPLAELEADQWVRVEGPIYPLGNEVVVQASSVTDIERPKRPYLSS